MAAPFDSGGGGDEPAELVKEDATLMTLLPVAYSAPPPPRMSAESVEAELRRMSPLHPQRAAFIEVHRLLQDNEQLLKDVRASQDGVRAGRSSGDPTATIHRKIRQLNSNLHRVAELYERCIVGGEPFGGSKLPVLW